MRPRISDELAERITHQANLLLADSPTESTDLEFERRLMIVFEAGSEATTYVGRELDYDEDDEDGHPAGKAAAEELIVGVL